MTNRTQRVKVYRGSRYIPGYVSLLAAVFLPSFVIRTPRTWDGRLPLGIENLRKEEITL